MAIKDGNKTGGKFSGFFVPKILRYQVFLEME
jgi:hypothetical protein